VLRYVSAALAMALRLCLSVTCWFFTKTSGRIEQVFGMEASFDIAF